jgi:hypothetical protein
VNVVPAAVWPAATLFEAVPKQLLSGAVHDFLVIPRDAYGNPGASGAVVRVKATQTGQQEAQACAVAREDRTGAYTARLALTRAGAAVLRVWVQHDANASATGKIPHLLEVPHVWRWNMRTRHVNIMATWSTLENNAVRSSRNVIESPLFHLDGLVALHVRSMLDEERNTTRATCPVTHTLSLDANRR